MSLSDTISNILYTIKKYVYDKKSADNKFVKYTDLPTTTQAGPVKAGNWLSIDDGSTNGKDRGKMKCGELTLEQYQTCKGYTFISKTTLENALSGKGYLTSASLNGYAKTSDIPSLTDYAKKTDIPNVSNFITASALENYALKNEIPDVSGFITETALNNKGYLTSASLTNYVKQEDLTGYAKTSDIPSLTGYATENFVTTRGYITSSALNGYAKTTDIPSLEGYAKTTDIPSLEGYAKTTDIPSLTNYYTKSEIDAMLVNGDEVEY